MFFAGGLGLPHHLNMSVKLESAFDSPQFGANTSGATRYDLVYATISYSVSATGSRKIKDVNTAVVSTQVLNLEKAPQVTLTVLPNVQQGNPTQNLPGDAADGSIYNFPLCYVAIPSAYVQGAGIAQTSINPLWRGGWIAPQRIHGMRPCSIYYSSANERPGSALQAGALYAERWGSDNRFFAHLKLLPNTPIQPSQALTLDASIDWSFRMIWIWVAYLGSATVLPLEGNANSLGVANAGPIPSSAWFSGPGNNIPGGPAIAYSGQAQVDFQVNGPAGGTLQIWRTGALVDGTNGDAVAILLVASDRFVPNG
jgi:hypothetical protein